MLKLDQTTRKLQAVLSGAVTTNQLPCMVSYSDDNGTTYVGGTQLTNTNSTTAVDICAAPGASTVRDIDYLSIRNRDTVAATVTVMLDDNGTDYEIVKAALAVGDQLTYTHGDGWRVIDADGNLKTGGSSGTGDVVGPASATANSLARFDGTTGKLLKDGAVIGADIQAYSANLATWSGITPGTGVGTALAVTIGSAGAVVTNGGALGTPASGTLTNCSGLPASGVSGTALVSAAIGTTVQAYDADLATIAGLTATSDNFIQAKSSAWASRTPAQVTADLITMVGDSGSGGTKGLVPAPGAGDAAADKYLKADGTWAVPAGGGAALPTGTVIWFAASTAPTGYLKANGALVSRTTYAALFAVIGTTFGAGDGSTTFALPNLCGEFVRGFDDGRGVDSGRSFGSAQADELESHKHTLTYPGRGYTPSGGGTYGVTINTNNQGNDNLISNTGGSETRPRNIALLACIKY